MIPSEKTDVQRSGNMTAQQSIAMKFDENSIAHIMSVLTDLYSDPELAVLREYATNARDSHIEAGQTRPIEVTLPSPLMPMLKIKDYGLGLSVNDVEQIYSRYGASTKRGTNEQTGMLGLGCKSGLTYTSQFNVISVKAGVKITVSVGRNDDGSGVMEVIDTCATDEPNGVEIIIPAKQHNDFQHKAGRFFRFWPSGSVLINGEPNVSVTDTASKISDTLFIVNNLDSDYVVMGNVAYPAKIYNQPYYWNRQFGVVAFVEMGTVDFTPSREQLHNTPRTIKAIEAIAAEFKRGAHRAAQIDIDNAATGHDAVEKFYLWDKVLNNVRPNEFTWKGKPLEVTWKQDVLNFRPYTRRYAARMESRIDHSTLVKSVVIGVDDINNFNLTTTLKSKVRVYLEETDLNTDIVVFADSTPWLEWATPKAIVSIDDIKAVKLQRQQNQRQRGTFEIFDGYRRTVTELPDNKQIVFVGPRESYMESPHIFNNLDDCVIVVLGENRWDKFKRDFPEAMHVTDYAQQAFDDAMDSISDEVKRAYAAQHKIDTDWLRLDESRLDDPEVVEYLREARLIKKTSLTRINNAISLYSRFGVKFNVPDYESNIGVLSERYPLTYQLLKGYYTSKEAIEDLYLYMNTKYRETTNE